MLFFYCLTKNNIFVLISLILLEKETGKNELRDDDSSLPFASISGTLAVLLHSFGTFFRYQIKLCASSFSVTFYNFQIWYLTLTGLLSCKFSDISPFLYIFSLAVASNSNVFQLMKKLYLYNHSLCSRQRH